MVAKGQVRRIRDRMRDREGVDTRPRNSLVPPTPAVSVEASVRTQIVDDLGNKVGLRRLGSGIAVGVGGPVCPVSALEQPGPDSSASTLYAA